MNDISDNGRIKVLFAQLCLTLCNPMDCSPPGTSVHGISQARILEWAVIPLSRGSFQHRIEPKSPELQADLSHQGSPKILHREQWENCQNQLFQNLN